MLVFHSPTNAAPQFRRNNPLHLFFKQVSIPLKSTCTHPVPIEFRKCAIVKGVKYHVENYTFVDVCAHHLFSLKQAKQLF